MKLWVYVYRYKQRKAAAFRRLCVETIPIKNLIGMLCAAAFRRLCVETPDGNLIVIAARRSRLQAAVC